MKIYDPNKARSMKTGHRMELIFQQWEYKASFVVTVGGNCSGMENLSSAVGIVYDELPDNERDEPYLVLESIHKDDDGNPIKLLIEGDGVELADEDKLMRMLVSARVVDVDGDWKKGRGV